MDKLGYDPDSIDDSEMENEVDDSDSPNVGFTYENNGVFAGSASAVSGLPEAALGAVAEKPQSATNVEQVSGASSRDKSGSPQAETNSERTSGSERNGDNSGSPQAESNSDRTSGSVANSDNRPAQTGVEPESFPIPRPGVDRNKPGEARVDERLNVQEAQATKLKLALAVKELNKRWSDLSPTERQSAETIMDAKKHIDKLNKTLQLNLSDQERMQVKLKLEDAYKQRDKEWERLTPAERENVKSALEISNRVRNLKERIYGSPATVERPGVDEKPGAIGKPGAVEKPGGDEKPGAIGKPGAVENSGVEEKPGAIGKLNAVEKPGLAEKPAVGEKANAGGTDKKNRTDEESLEAYEHRLLRKDNERFNELWTRLSPEERNTVSTLAELRRGILLNLAREKDQTITENERAAAQASRANMELWEGRIRGAIPQEQQDKVDRVLQLQDRIAFRLQYLNPQPTRPRAGIPAGGK